MTTPPAIDTVDVTVQRTFTAPAERVFDAWLTPRLLGQWMMGPGIREEKLRRPAAAKPRAAPAPAGPKPALKPAVPAQPKPLQPPKPPTQAPRLAATVAGSKPLSIPVAAPGKKPVAPARRGSLETNATGKLGPNAAAGKKLPPKPVLQASVAANRPSAQPQSAQKAPPQPKKLAKYVPGKPTKMRKPDLGAPPVEGPLRLPANYEFRNKRFAK